MRDHIKELGHTTPKEPLFFLKPSSAILPPQSGPVLRPRGVNLHYEAELVLVMGRDVRDFQGEDEGRDLDLIDGYAVGIDMTARNIQQDAIKNGLPWDIAKGYDTFLPLSNKIPKAKIRDPYSIELYLDVNGETRQRDLTGLMLSRIPRIIGAISRVMTLERGDLILTGTPKGVGPVFPGDTLTAGLRVDGQEIEEGRIEVEVKEREGGV
ncbi:MAG: hypothetical protein M1815_001126 [Lichina confinis]|nr:MAG: hypothetical protein M1815_001126 [Lichina confinis]